MERRIGLRGRTDFRVVAKNGILSAFCRGIEVSPNGILLDRGQLVLPRDMPFLLDIRLCLPERILPIHALTRPIWCRGSQQAVKFIEISDVDRLTLAEHLDLLHHRGVALH